MWNDFFILSGIPIEIFKNNHWSTFVKEKSINAWKICLKIKLKSNPVSIYSSILIKIRFI